jgi:hypothetical protein
MQKIFETLITLLSPIIMHFVHIIAHWERQHRYTKNIIILRSI